MPFCWRPHTYLTDLTREHQTHCRPCLESCFLGSPNPGLKGGTVQFYQLLRDADAASNTCMIRLGFHSSVAQFNSQLVTHIPHPAVHNATTGVHLGRQEWKPVTLSEANQQSCLKLISSPSWFPSNWKILLQHKSKWDIKKVSLQVLQGLTLTKYGPQ